MSNEACLYQSSSKQAQLKIALDLLSKVPIKDGEHILDIGCGTGNLLQVLSEMVKNGGTVTGIDPNPQRIAAAKDLLKNYSNVDLHICKCVELPITKLFNHAISIFVLHWIPEDELLLTFQSLYDSLPQGGTFSGIVCTSRPVGNWERFFRLCCETDTNFKEQFEEAEKECLHWHSGDWLQANIENIGFRITLFEEVVRVDNMGCSQNFCDWLVATYSDSPIGTLDLRKMWRIIDGDYIVWDKLSDGGIALTTNAHQFIALKD